MAIGVLAFAAAKRLVDRSDFLSRARPVLDEPRRAATPKAGIVTRGPLATQRGSRPLHVLMLSETVARGVANQAALQPTDGPSATSKADCEHAPSLEAFAASRPETVPLRHRFRSETPSGGVSVVGFEFVVPGTNSPRPSIGRSGFSWSSFSGAPSWAEVPRGPAVSSGHDGRHLVVEVELDGLHECLGFERLADLLELLLSGVVGDVERALGDDRSLVQIGRHVVGGDARDADALLVRLSVGGRAGERREQRRVDVDDAAS